jgi:hypothetical protein
MDKEKISKGFINLIEALGINNYFVKELIKVAFDKFMQIPDEEIEKYKEIERLAKKYAKIIKNEINNIEKNFTEKSFFPYFIFITMFLSNISEEKYDKNIYKE